METTLLTPASFTEIVRSMDVSADLVERWRAEMERGEREAKLTVSHDGRQYLSMVYTPKDNGLTVR